MVCQKPKGWRGESERHRQAALKASAIQRRLGQIYPGLGPSGLEGLNPLGLKTGQRITIDGVKGKVTSITPAGLPMGYLLGPGGKKSRAAFRAETLRHHEVKVED